MRITALKHLPKFFIHPFYSCQDTTTNAVGWSLKIRKKKHCFLLIILSDTKSQRKLFFTVRYYGFYFLFQVSLLQTCRANTLEGFTSNKSAPVLNILKSGTYSNSFFYQTAKLWGANKPAQNMHACSSFSVSTKSTRKTLVKLRPKVSSKGQSKIM